MYAFDHPIWETIPSANAADTMLQVSLSYSNYPKSIKSSFLAHSFQWGDN